MGFFKLIVIIFFTLPILFNYSTCFSKIQNNNLSTKEELNKSPQVLVSKASNQKNNPKTPSNTNSKTTIKSKKIIIKRDSGRIEFIQDAIVENADTSILADKIIVFYDESKKGKDNVIQNIKAIGNVKIFNQEFVTTGESGSYDPKKEIFTIIKNVVFNNGTSIAKGEKFIYDVKTQTGYLTGSDEKKKNLESGRVTIIINESNE